MRAVKKRKKSKRQSFHKKKSPFDPSFSSEGSIDKEAYNSGEAHQEDRVGLELAQQNQGNKKQDRGLPIKVGEQAAGKVRGLKKGQEQDGEPCGHDQTYGGGLQAFQGGGNIKGVLMLLEKLIQADRDETAA